MIRDSGLYEIVNTANGKRYVGSAVNFHLRWRHHKSALRCGTHKNCHLQRAHDKYGLDAFEFRVLRLVPRDELHAAESALLAEVYGRPDYYNLTDSADTPNRGKVMPASHREKISAANKGRSFSPEHRLRLSEAHKGVPLSSAHCEAMGRARRGRKASWAARANMSKAQSGRVITEEHKAKMRAAWVIRRAREQGAKNVV